MIDPALRSKILHDLALEHVSAEQQDRIIENIEANAQKRLAALIPDMLTAAQHAEIAAMQAQGMSDRDVLQWIVEHLPSSYDALLRAAILGVADEMTELGRQLRERSNPSSTV